MTTDNLLLPDRIVSLRQIRQCIRALETVENELISETVKVRAGVEDEPQSIPIPTIVEELIKTNNIELKNKRDVQALKKRLVNFATKAPRLKFTFPSEPDDSLLIKLVGWLRHNINLYVLVDVTVSSYITGGFILQTPTRRYDLSWRQRFEDQSYKLAEIVNQDKGQDSNV